MAKQFILSRFWYQFNAKKRSAESPKYPLIMEPKRDKLRLLTLMYPGMVQLNCVTHPNSHWYRRTVSVSNSHRYMPKINDNLEPPSSFGTYDVIPLKCTEYLKQNQKMLSLKLTIFVWFPHLSSHGVIRRETKIGALKLHCNPVH
jgi:hypothetical protein